MSSVNHRFLVLALLSACKFGDGFEPYYSGGGAPEVSGLDVTSEAGNTGGQTVVISGENFGGDPAGVTVIFGSRNARVLRASDSLLEVEVPPGPLQAGPVDIVVGTAQGQARLKGGYVYDTGTIDRNETAYIAVTNDFWSCYGGIGRADIEEFFMRNGNTFEDVGGLCTVWAFSGDAGIAGRSEFLQWAFPRLHSVYTGERGGFATSSDFSWGKWSFQNPGYSVNTLDLESEYEDWRHNVGSFSLRNPVHGDETFCSDLSAITEYRYGGWETAANTSGDEKYYYPTTVQGGRLSVKDGLEAEEVAATLLDQADCSKTVPTWAKEYDLDTLQFCPEKLYETPQSKRYLPEWPVGEDFFLGSDGAGGVSPDYPVTVFLDAPDLGLHDLELVLPEYSFFEATIGSAGSEQYPDMWALLNPDPNCPDSDGDGRTGLSDAVWRWEWKPTEAPLTESSRVLESRVYVRATVSDFTLAWYGGENFPVRASITVPDDWNYDATRGTSYLDLPAEVMYRFPTNVYPGASADPMFSGYSLLIVTLERVVEYRIKVDVDPRGRGSQNGKFPGEVVFSYSTGDISQTVFDNPLDLADCYNCIDGDGDGWTDANDPDCAGGDAEDGSTFGDSTCNDGVDNDGNGLADADDPICESGADVESNCDDSIDNDGDGLMDELDGECSSAGSGFELGDDDPTWGCIDATDNDGDGWTDFDDPDCTNGADDEVGFGTTECNDGIDNDGHGDVDATDPMCIGRGPEYSSETRLMGDECVDGTDNDGDGYTDANDPDCEYNGRNEVDLYVSSTTDPNVPACYNGEDDDGDGFVDADDPGCTNEAGDPDGYVRDEDVANPGWTACADSVDNDGDGWVDAEDPDCGTSAGEWGLGSTQCNDGADNDGDGATDGDDPECPAADDDDEGA